MEGLITGEIIVSYKNAYSITIAGRYLGGPITNITNLRLQNCMFINNSGRFNYREIIVSYKNAYSITIAGRGLEL